MDFSNKYATIALNTLFVFFGAWTIDLFQPKPLSSLIRGLIIAFLISLAMYYIAEKAKKKAADKLINQ